MSIKNLSRTAAAAVMVILYCSAGAQTEQRSWQYYFKRGKLQFKAEMYDYSLLSMARALELNPSLYQAVNYLADIYAIKGKKIQSLENLERSLGINPAQADVHNKTGELYEFFQYREKAFGHFKTAVELEPGHVMGNMNLVRHYIRIGKPEIAAHHLTASYAGGSTLAGEIMTGAGDAEKRGDAMTALKLYDDVLKKNPAELAAYDRIFELFRSMKKFRKAADILERLVFVKPDHEQAYIRLGHLYFADPLPGKKERHLKKSIHYFQEAIRINPGNADTLFSLSQVYRYMGKTDEAEAAEKKMGNKTPR